MNFTINNQVYNYNRDRKFLKTLFKEIDGHISLDSVSHSVENFIHYKMMEDFTMDSEMVKELKRRGIRNVNNYSYDYWKCKLQDNRVRERFYKDKLFTQTESLVDLTDHFSPFAMDMITKLDDYLPDNVYIAGGLLASLLSVDFTNEGMYPETLEEVIDTIDCCFPKSDIDLFVVGDLDPIIDLNALIGTEHVDKGHIIEWGAYYKCVQLIKRRYRSPAEIVFSFDLDASGLVLIGDKIYGNKCAEYAIVNRVNHFDLDRAGPYYTHRLIKYVVKGFTISIPQLDTTKVDFKMISALYLTTWDKSVKDNFHPFVKLVFAMYYKGYHQESNIKDVTSYYEDREDSCGIDYVDSLDFITPCEKQFNTIDELFDNEYYGDFNSKLIPVLDKECVHFHKDVVVKKDLKSFNKFFYMNGILQYVRGLCSEGRDNSKTLFICRENKLKQIKKDYEEYWRKEEKSSSRLLKIKKMVSIQSDEEDDSSS